MTEEDCAITEEAELSALTDGDCTLTEEVELSALIEEDCVLIEKSDSSLICPRKMWLPSETPILDHSSVNRGLDSGLVSYSASWSDEATCNTRI